MLIWRFQLAILTQLRNIFGYFFNKVCRLFFFFFFFFFLFYIFPKTCHQIQANISSTSNYIILFSLTEEFTFPAFLSMKIAKFNCKINHACDENWKIFHLNYEYRSVMIILSISNIPF
jgi:hypothetical protein